MFGYTCIRISRHLNRIFWYSEIHISGYADISGYPDIRISIHIDITGMRHSIPGNDSGTRSMNLVQHTKSRTRHHAGFTQCKNISGRVPQNNQFRYSNTDFHLRATTHARCLDQGCMCSWYVDTYAACQIWILDLMCVVCLRLLVLLSVYILRHACFPCTVLLTLCSQVATFPCTVRIAPYMHAAAPSELAATVVYRRPSLQRRSHHGQVQQK